MDSIYDHACIVEMKTLEDAERAIERLHDTKFDGTYVGIKVQYIRVLFMLLRPFLCTLINVYCKQILFQQVHHHNLRPVSTT